MPDCLDEQDAGEIERLETVLAVYRAHASMLSSQDHADWASENIAASEIISWVRELQTSDKPDIP